MILALASAVFAGEIALRDLPVHTQGRIWILDAGAGRARVLMQSTAEVHGFIGLFATRGYKRKSAFAATRSHLGALLDLARAR